MPTLKYIAKINANTTTHTGMTRYTKQARIRLFGSQYCRALNFFAFTISGNVVAQTNITTTPENTLPISMKGDATKIIAPTTTTNANNHTASDLSVAIQPLLQYPQIVGAQLSIPRTSSIFIFLLQCGQYVMGALNSLIVCNVHAFTRCKLHSIFCK